MDMPERRVLREPRLQALSELLWLGVRSPSREQTLQCMLEAV